MKKISIVTPCFNEEGSVEELNARIKQVMEQFNYEYDHIFIDNASTDGTLDKIRAMAAKDKRVKAIINARNFGPVRSPYYGLLQADGDAVIELSSDLQDPPEQIAELIRKWEEGYKIAVAVKSGTAHVGIIPLLRKLYYRVLRKLADVPLIENFTGFGLYDRKVIEILRELRDPHPYFRGLISEIGLPCARVEFFQEQRKHGSSKINLFTLYDIAVLGITGYTKIPLRLTVMVGFLGSTLSFITGLIYLAYKLLFWSQFTLGSAPIVIGLFFLGSIQLFSLGVVGEYIGTIYTQVMRRPLVIEKERINF